MLLVAPPVGNLRYKSNFSTSVSCRTRSWEKNKKGELKTSFTPKQSVSHIRKPVLLEISETVYFNQRSEPKLSTQCNFCDMVSGYFPNKYMFMFIKDNQNLGNCLT